MSLRKTPVALALTLAFPLALTLPLNATAQAAATPPAGTPPAAEAKPTPLGELTVSATRTERAVDSVPATVTVIDRKRLDLRDARDMKDLLAHEVDLAVDASTPRFTAAGASTGRAGNRSINIRGLDGNRVLITLDGIRLPQTYAFGAFASGRLDFVDLDSLAGAEVLRGPASTSFGSDGLAGALTLRTLSPEDLLKGRAFAGYAKLAALTADDSRHASAAVAFGGGDWSSLVQASIRRGHETKNRADNSASNANRTKPNPTDVDTDSVMAKLGYRVNAQHRLLAAIEHRERSIDMTVLSAIAVTPAPTTPVLGLVASDKLERTRVSLEHRYEDLNAAWIQQVTTHLYAQDSETRQYSAEDRIPALPDRIRDGRYKEKLVGLSSQGQSQLANHRVSFGLDVSRNTIEGVRDGTVPPAGEAFPNKPFPDTRYYLAGAFIQDEIELGDVSIIPALRYEYYKLSPDAAGYSGAAVPLSDSAVTPRLGLVWRATPSLQPYAQWSLGFRAPTPDQVNNGFSNPTQFYSSIGNPNLKAERANSVEVGLRGQFAETLRWQLAGYDNRYKDFISQETISGTGGPTSPLVFQYINLAEARIKGVEARVIWDAMPGLNLTAAVARSRGHSIENGAKTPLDSIQPLRASLGARWEHGDWTLQGDWTHSAGKKSKDISNATWFAPGSYDVVDLGARYRFSKMLSAQAWVTNLFDKKYWRWSDVPGIASTSPILDTYTAPGRALQVSLRADF